jgi:hypothetical protein
MSGQIRDLLHHARRLAVKIECPVVTPNFVRLERYAEPMGDRIDQRPSGQIWFRVAGSSLPKLEPEIYETEVQCMAVETILSLS